MSIIAIEDKKFEVFITREEIAVEVQNIAGKMNRELKGKEVVFIGMLNGAFMFLSDLLKKITFNCRVSFLKMISYDGFHSSGDVQRIIGLNEDITGKVVIILEDIIDSGLTIKKVLEVVKAGNPSVVKIATLLFKPGNYNDSVKIDYVGFEIPNDYVLGYGLDYNGFGRNLEDIYKVIE